MSIDAIVLGILGRSEIEGSILRLPDERLDRKTYEAVNTVIVIAGGKWNKKWKGHVFDCDAADVIDGILLTGEVQNVRQDFGQFDSPPAVVARVVKLAEIRHGLSALEPSAGIGNIALAATEAGATVDCYEIDEKRFTRLKQHMMDGVPLGMLWRGDFLGQPSIRKYDRVVMNPPFAKQADIKHVTHAAKFLKPGGRLVAIMSASVTFRTDARSEDFRTFINSRGAAQEVLPPQSFKESGTGVNAVVVSFTSPDIRNTA